MYVIMKGGKYMGCGEPEGTAWYDDVTPEVVKGSKEMMDCQKKHLASRINLTGAEVVRL